VAVVENEALGALVDRALVDGRLTVVFATEKKMRSNKRIQYENTRAESVEGKRVRKRGRERK